MERYPVNTGVAVYAPATFLVFGPFGMLPPELSSVAYFGLTVVLTLALAWAAFRVAGWRPALPAVLAFGGLLLIGRPGHWNLLSGQVTLIFVLATYGALSFARGDPRVAGMGLALALLKPSFGVPLLPALLARGAGRAVAWGLGIATALNLPVLIVLIRREGGIAPFATTVADSYRMFVARPNNDTLQGVWRVDLAATISRLIDQPLGTVTGSVDSHRERALNSLLCCAVLLSLYHQAYDLLLLALPVAALVCTVRESGRPHGRHVAQALLFTVIGVNYVATQSALAALRLGPEARLVTLSVNGMALLALFGLYLAEVMRAGTARS
jgi:hypothetical protein